MSFYQIDSRAIRNKKEELAALLQRFRSQKEELCANEISLRSMWEGEANERFHAEFMKNAGWMDTFIGVTDRYISVIEAIAGRYEMAEQKNLGRAMQ